MVFFLLLFDSSLLPLPFLKWRNKIYFKLLFMNNVVVFLGIEKKIVGVISYTRVIWWWVFIRYSRNVLYLFHLYQKSSSYCYARTGINTFLQYCPIYCKLFKLYYNTVTVTLFWLLINIGYNIKQASGVKIIKIVINNVK